MGKRRLVVLVSGNGSNLQAIIDGQQSGKLDAVIAGVVSNNAEAFGLVRADQAGIPTQVMEHGPAQRSADGRRTYDEELAYVVSCFGADLVVLAGWNRLLTSSFVSRHTTINLHPAEPGKFPGLHAIERTFEAWQQGNVSAGGVMVHYVPDEGVDDGPVIAWESVPIMVDDTLESFECRVHDVEHRLLLECIVEVLDSLPPTGA